MSCDDDALPCCECNATDPEHPLKSSVAHRDFVSSSLCASCSVNNLGKGSTRAVQPPAVGDDSHLGGRYPAWLGREPQIFSCRLSPFAVESFL